jgi:hypothetical protein
MSTKKCRRCKEEKPVGKFFLRDKATGRRDRTCMSCRADQQRDARAKCSWPRTLTESLIDLKSNHWRYPVSAGAPTWRAW